MPMGGDGGVCGSGSVQICRGGDNDGLEAVVECGGGGSFVCLDLIGDE